jgi:CCAAT/enhancer binding protein (C/EBP)
MYDRSNPDTGSAVGAASATASPAKKKTLATASTRGGAPSVAGALRVRNLNATAAGGANTNGELAELTSTELSLDLQGLIDDASFTDDNLFGDLVDAKKNELNHGYGLHHNARTSPTGSSGHSSPTGVSGGGVGPNSGGSNYPNYRNALAYLPGSVHNGANASGNGYAPSSASSASSSSSTSTVSSNGSPNSIQVKLEPSDNGGGEYAAARHHVMQTAAQQAAQHNSFNNNNTSAYSSGTVSSTTPGMSITPFGGPSSNLSSEGGLLPSLKSFATPPKYMLPGNNSHGGHISKKKVDRNSDEYRRRRERNNVAVRKSREKAKARTQDTEVRVKILARDNERLQKKVELLQEELSVLRSLFSNVGVLPEHIHRELSKHMDNFQQQHNAMACM